MVRVCDAIMGSGKTSATISYINAHPEKRFIYITPYLPEAKRISDGCPDAHFVEPSKKLPKYGFSKANHTLALIEEGRNIASTHQATLYYTDETIRALREKNYTLIVDEEVNILQKAPEISYSDIQLAIDAGYIRETAPNEYTLEPKADSYSGGKLSHMFRLMKSRDLIYLKHGAGVRPYYWIFPKKLFTELDDIIVLTYMMKGSEMELFLHMNGVDFSYIGISRTDDGGYEFSDRPDYVPRYVSSLKDMISIEKSEKMNEVGWKKNALSMNWYKTCSPDQMERLKKNIYNYFRFRSGSKSASDRMCGTYKDYWGTIRGKGFWNSNVVFSMKSSNEFRDKTVLVYPVNLFANGEIVRFYAEHGESFDGDRYALSIMLQWIWRSAIRDGKPISIYIPSKRMRDLLEGWISSVQNGGELIA